MRCVDGHDPEGHGMLFFFWADDVFWCACATLLKAIASTWIVIPCSYLVIVRVHRRDSDPTRLSAVPDEGMYALLRYRIIESDYNVGHRLLLMRLYDVGWALLECDSDGSCMMYLAVCLRRRRSGVRVLVWDVQVMLSVSSRRM
jgi:hypothetical protein